MAREASNVLEKPLASKAMRKQAVLAATGWSNSTLYEKIKAGKFPAPIKLDPDGRASVWLEEWVAAVQKRAIERQNGIAKSASAEVRKLAAIGTEA